MEERYDLLVLSLSDRASALAESNGRKVLDRDRPVVVVKPSQSG